MGRLLGLIYIWSQSCAKFCKHSANNSWLNWYVTEEGLSSGFPPPSHTHLFVSSTFVTGGDGLRVFSCWLSQLSGKSSPFLFRIRRWRNLKMQELKNLIRGCKHKSLLSKHLLCTGPYSKHFLWVNLLTSQQSCEADGYHPGFADDETEHRKVEKVSQGHTLGSGRAGIFIQTSSLQGFALYNSLWFHLLCPTTDHTGFLGVAQFESAKEKIWGQLCVSLTPFEQGSWHPWEVSGAWVLLWGPECKDK